MQSAVPIGSVAAGCGDQQAAALNPMSRMQYEPSVVHGDTY
ncbi:hypothetical protein OKW40_000633 [Paraburkholderia sp. RAU6.4a]